MAPGDLEVLPLTLGGLGGVLQAGQALTGQAVEQLRRELVAGAVGEG